MHRHEPIMLLAVFALALAAQPAAADEIGGSGFKVPQDEWLWGIEGLVRTPVDFTANVGLAFIDYEQKNVAQHHEDGNIRERDGDLEYKPEAFQGGFRFSGGIGYWNCCVLIEPAMAFGGHHPFDGGDKRSDGRRINDPDGGDGEFAFADGNFKEGWDLVFGPLMTWKIPEDAPVAGRFLGGLPLVFFPFVGVAHQEWDATLTKIDEDDPIRLDVERNFREDMFVVGFDLDIPLPGALGPFTHALTFGYKWTEGGEKHDMFESFDQENEIRKFTFKSTEGSRYELRYTVYWNDFEGFFKRVIFGPAS